MFVLSAVLGCQDIEKLVLAPITVDFLTKLKAHVDSLMSGVFTL